MVASDAVSEEDIDKLIIPDDLSSSAYEPTFKAYIEAKVYDKERHIIQYHRQPMRSLTQYFLALMSIPLIGTYQNPGADSATGILTNVLGLPSQQSTTVNTAYNPPVDNANIMWNWAIQLGSGTQAFSLSLNSLAAPILNGTGTGQLSYEGLSVAYGSSTLYVVSAVANYTSSSVTVSEIGLQCTIYILYANSSHALAYNSYSFLLSYDTFSTAISIPAYGMATFQITLSFTG